MKNNRSMRQAAWLAIGTRGIVLSVAMLLPTSPAWSSVYFVDSQNGSDTGSGTATNTAWQTLGKVNATSLAAGDSVLFKCGGAWTGSLAIAHSGTNNNPITYTSYGSGSQPAIGVTNVTPVISVTGNWIVLAGLHIIGNGDPSGYATWAVAITGSHVTVTNCIDKGVNLGYTNDSDGVAVPQGAAPDIGAYEFMPGTRPPTKKEIDP